MEKLKISIIFILGILTLGYNLITTCLIDLFNDSEIIILLQGHISTDTNDNYFGTIFDYIIGFIFNVNIRDLHSYIKFFGG